MIVLVVGEIDPKLTPSMSLVPHRATSQAQATFHVLAWLFHIITIGIHDVLHMPKGMLVKGSVFGLLEQRINFDIASLPPSEITQVHTIRDGLDVASDDLNQVLEN